MERGWYPNKKHTVGQRLGQVASLGIYNPDDRELSRYNKQILSNKVQNAAVKARAEDLLSVQEAERVKSMERLHGLLVQAGVTPEKATTMVANTFGAQGAKTDVAEMQAREQGALVNRDKAAGALPGASAAGKYAMDAESAMAQSNKEIADKQAAEAKAETSLGVPAQRARTTQSGLSTQDAANKFGGAKIGMEYDIFNKVAPTTYATGVQGADNTLNEALVKKDDIANAKTLSGAMGDKLRQPGIAEALTTAELDKGSPIIPFGGSRYPNMGGAPQFGMSQEQVMGVRTVDPETGQVINSPLRRTILPGQAGTNTTATPLPAGPPAAALDDNAPMIWDRNLKRFTPKGNQ